jgi:hypothetical protein
MAEMSVEILDAKNTSKSLLLIEDVKGTDSVLTLKKKLSAKSESFSESSLTYLNF